MKIAIIGAGWFGCHIASKLLDESYEIKIFEKEKKIFNNASGNNQNRLHLGFHYPRSKETIELSKASFFKFKKEYNFLTKKIKNNIYSISNSKKSKINFKDYCKILKVSKLKFKKLNSKNSITQNFKNIEGSIICDEELILISRSIDFFNRKLKSKINFNSEVKKVVFKNKSYFINGNRFDYVIDCTGYSFKKNKLKNLRYEFCVIFLYKKEKNNDDFAITIMDGPFFTLYPWNEKNEYGLYSVQSSRIISSKNIVSLKKRVHKSIKSQLLNKKRKSVESKFLKYYPEFKKKFKFKRYLFSYRTIIKNKFDTRVYRVTNKNKFISVFPGKIDHIFYAYNEIKKCLNKF